MFSLICLFTFLGFYIFTHLIHFPPLDLHLQHLIHLLFSNMHTRLTFLPHAHCTTNTLSSPIIPITTGPPRHPPAHLAPLIANVNNPKQKSRKTKQSSRIYTLLSDKKVKIIVNNQKFFLTSRPFCAFPKHKSPSPSTFHAALHDPSAHQKRCIYLLRTAA